MAALFCHTIIERKRKEAVIPMRRIKKRWIIIPVFFLVIIALCSYIYQEEQKITGEEWLSVQSTYIDEMSIYADNMDTIFALYIGGSISEADFLNHIEILEDELTVMVAARDELQDKYEIKTGSHTYSSKKGCEAVDHCYLTLKDILDMARNNYQDVDVLSYKYLAFHQEVIDDLADYMAAIEILEAEEEEMEGQKNE